MLGDRGSLPLPARHRYPNKEDKTHEWRDKRPRADKSGEPPGSPGREKRNQGHSDGTAPARSTACRRNGTRVWRTEAREDTECLFVTFAATFFIIVVTTQPHGYEHCSP
jgi:hypothetical protein